MRNMILALALLPLALASGGCGDSPTGPEMCETITEEVTTRITTQGQPHGLGARRLEFLRDVSDAECERVGTDVRTTFAFRPSDGAAVLNTILVGVWECERCAVGGST